ncbi:heme o synthase [Stygiolobus azoricus]|uniref:Protoheme IX farnesyltransferase n=1 Tax=Stygiolobus azoricus TaxID=41675 RepID=A0A650CP07_9CREN|nr:heme o synthase [Stygiolobus azoricus]QGR19503.1 protoheme IX farnesyltransferase [Stygiolobus azoricus]
MSIAFSRKLNDYIKLAKPRVISLLDIAALAGFVLGLGKSVNIFSWIHLLPVLIGGSLAAGGGMIINGGLEIEKDKLMKRNSWRPTVKGEVSKGEAYTVGIVAAIIGTVVGLLDNLLTSFFIAFGFLVYVLVYSIWLKPRTWWNIVIGGLAGSAAAWAGYAASSGVFNFESLLLGLLVFMWTPGHFWSLALRFKDDYVKAEIPMLPVLVDERTSAKAIAVSNILMIPFALSLTLYLGVIYGILVSILSMILLYYNFRLIKNPNKDEAWRSFKFSSPYLAIILIIAIILRLV